MKTRQTVEETHADEITGVGYDCPKLPATILIDDINEVIIEMQDFGPENYCYKLTQYPPSHHMR